MGATDSILGGLTGGLFDFMMGERKYERDRNDANRDWDRQNAYNSPKAQMERFKEAGLNPNLMYGQGTPGNASASPLAAQKSGAPEHKLDLQQIYGDAKRLEANMQQTQQTVENLKTNQELMKTNMELSRMLMPHRISNLDSQTTWREGMLEPSIGEKYLKMSQENQKMDLNRQANERQERMLKSTLSLNSYRSQNIQAQTALTTQLRLKEVQKTITASNEASYSKVMAQEKLAQIEAQTAAILQGRETSMTVADLNKANMALRNYQSGFLPLDKFLSIINSIKTR